MNGLLQPTTTSGGLRDMAFAQSYLSVSRFTVKRLIAEGSLRSIKVGRRRLIEIAELDRYIESLR